MHHFQDEVSFLDFLSRALVSISLNYLPHIDDMNSKMFVIFAGKAKCAT